MEGIHCDVDAARTELSAPVPEPDLRPGRAVEPKWDGFRTLVSVAQGDRTGRTPPALEGVPAAGQQHGLPAGGLVTELRAHLGQPPHQQPVHPVDGRHQVGGVRQGAVGVAELPVDPDPPMPGVRPFSAIPL